MSSARLQAAFRARQGSKSRSLTEFPGLGFAKLFNKGGRLQVLTVVLEKWSLKRYLRSRMWVILLVSWTIDFAERRIGYCPCRTGHAVLGLEPQASDADLEGDDKATRSQEKED